jgi:hypothetical protein
MTDERLSVVGADEAFRDLARVVDRIGAAAEVEARRAGERLVSLVVPKVPRQTGRLAGSLTVDVLEGGAAAGYDGTAEYAGWIEFGGSHGRPYVDGGRYLYPTADPDAFVRALEASATDTIARYPWSKPR